MLNHVEEDQKLTAENHPQTRDFMDEDDDENLFETELEEYHEKTYLPDRNYEPLLDIDITSEIKKRRPLIKVVISRQRKEFENTFAFSNKVANDDISSGLFDMKSMNPKDFLMADRQVLEMGFQTANQCTEKTYQVQRVKTENSYTQVEENMKDILHKFESKAASYLNNPLKLVEIEKFVSNVKNKTEQALQSNETIDIFFNDFDLDRRSQMVDVTKEEKQQTDFRTFRDNNKAGQKSKREKCVNYIRCIQEDEDYLAHTLFRNNLFEEKIKSTGVPYPADILFWNFRDPEINSPVWQLEVPMEITCFEFNPVNSNHIACGFVSGQVMIILVNDLLSICKKSELEIKKSNIALMNSE
jgi:hypothetical protein